MVKKFTIDVKVFFHKDGTVGEVIADGSPEIKKILTYIEMVFLNNEGEIGESDE